jgi:hypothetical protein
MVCVPGDSRIKQKQLRSKDETNTHGSGWLNEGFAVQCRSGSISTRYNALQGGPIDALPLRARPVRGAGTVECERAICSNEDSVVGAVWGPTVGGVPNHTFSEAYCRSQLIFRGVFDMI